VSSGRDDHVGATANNHELYAEPVTLHWLLLIGAHHLEAELGRQARS
jgi:hypothetical protein